MREGRRYYNQNTLYACMKLSKNKFTNKMVDALKHFILKALSSLIHFWLMEKRGRDT